MKVRNIISKNISRNKKMYENTRKDASGITLVALVVTIIILIILAGVSITMVLGENGLIEKAKDAKEQTEQAKIDEQTSMNEAVEYIGNEGGAGSKPVLLEKGSFVEYNVAYTDAYVTANEYNSKNGWRILDYTDNGDGTYSNVKLISTGIPAKLYYYYNDTANSNWYVRDNTQLKQFKTLLGGSDYTFSTGTSTYYGLQASAGMYYNFKDIKFAYGTSNRGKSLGYFTKITTNGTTYDSTTNSTVEKTGGEIFNLYGNNAEVRLLTLPEMNRALGRTDIDSTSQVTTDTKGLYRLDQLKNVDGMGDKTYTTGWYWLASPYPDASNIVCYVYYSGLVISSISDDLGVRPSVCLTSDVQIIDENKDGVFEIEFLPQ